jgi:hypothetical protein
MRHDHPSHFILEQPCKATVQQGMDQVLGIIGLPGLPQGSIGGRARLGEVALVRRIACQAAAR